MAEVHCMSCGQDISTQSKDRRKLSSPTSQEVCRVLMDVVMEVHVLDVMEYRRIANGYVCKRCFRSLEKLVRMRAELKECTGNACASVKEALPYIVSCVSENDGCDEQLESAGHPVSLLMITYSSLCPPVCMMHRTYSYNIARHNLYRQLLRLYCYLSLLIQRIHQHQNGTGPLFL